jgi:ABC-type transport system involved in Fe-S cluster assembly fused permease/ATPase subunit
MKLTIRSLYILFVFLVSIYSVSCKKTPKPLSKEEIKRQIDSATNFRIHELYKEAQIDLERRIPIEVRC